MTGIRSRKTLYRNTIFRSSLEAEWAAFFDLHGIAWDYEPQTFTDGISWYLPDFFLPECFLRNSKRGGWLEIKPTSDINGKEDLLSFNKDKFGLMKDTQFCVFCGHPTKNDEESEYHRAYQVFPWFDNRMEFLKCAQCNTVKIEYQEGNYRYCPSCGCGTENLTGYF
jgi:hypothetical protein